MPKSTIEGQYKCSKCGVDKPLSEYYPVANPTFRSPSQFHVSRCKPCQSAGDAETQRKRLTTLRVEVIGHYSNGTFKCTCCGESGIRFLSIDHINRDGAAHRREIGHGSGKLYRWLVRNNFPSGFRVLCFNCNFVTANGGICPHEEARRMAIAAD